MARTLYTRQDLEANPELLERAEKCYEYSLQGYDIFQITDLTRFPPEHVKQLLSALTDLRNYVAPDPTIAARVSTLDAQIDQWIVRLNNAFDTPTINQDGSIISQLDVTKAITAFTRLAKLKIQIGGLAAPSRTDITVRQISAEGVDSIDAEIQALTIKLGLPAEPSPPSQHGNVIRGETL